MSSSDDAAFDQSARASVALEDALTQPDEDAQIEAEREVLQTFVAPEEARREAPVLQYESTRTSTRVLFVTTDHTYLTDGSSTQQQLHGLASVFDEVHLLVVGDRVPRMAEQKRLASNVWTYPVHGHSFVTMGWQAYRTVKQQLVFGGSFRPDIITALDPFEAGVVGYWIARWFQRPFQLHITENVFTPEYHQHDPHDKPHTRHEKFLLQRPISVRVGLQSIEKVIREHFPRVVDLALLPRYYHVAEILQATEDRERTRRYPQFAFTFLFVGELSTDSTLFRAVDALRFLLRSPRIGLIVVGDGAVRQSIIERTQILGVHEQVMFKSRTDDLLAEMYGVDMLINTDTNEASDTTIIQAAAAGLPMLIARTPFRDDLFEDGVSAFLCDPDDTIGFTQKATKFLDTNALRVQFARNARDVVRTRIEEDPNRYYSAIRDSIESVLVGFVSKEEQEAKKKRAKASKTADQEKTQAAPPTTINGIAMKMPENS